MGKAPCHTATIKLIDHHRTINIVHESQLVFFLCRGKPKKKYLKIVRNKSETAETWISAQKY